MLMVLCSLSGFITCALFLFSAPSITVNVFYAKQSSDVSLQFYPDMFWPRVIAQNGQEDIFMYINYFPPAFIDIHIL